MNGLTQERWSQLWQKEVNTVPPSECFQQLMAMYSEPTRHYHDQKHIADCLHELDQVRELVNEPTATELAIWFHDAVYDSHAADNEERSATLAKAWLGKFGANDALIGAVEQLVLATKSHDSKLHPDAPLLVDVDLSILGQPPGRFWEYEKQIRAEYSWVEQTVFATKRAEILEGFLSRPRIYQTKFYFERLETQARTNLRASIQLLRQHPTV